MILARTQVMVRCSMRDAKCQLCHRCGFSDDRDYATHVGKHLEEIALIALPPAGDSDEECSGKEDSREGDDSDDKGLSWLRPSSPRLDLATSEGDPRANQIPLSPARLPEANENLSSLQPPSLSESKAVLLLEPSPSPVPVGKKHQCPYCSTTFRRHHNLKSHLLTHTQERPYVCQTCEQRFRRIHDLKRHTKLHTGERPFVCQKCGRSFARGDSLNRHLLPPGGCTGRGKDRPDEDVNLDFETESDEGPKTSYTKGAASEFDGLFSDSDSHVYRI